MTPIVIHIADFELSTPAWVRKLAARAGCQLCEGALLREEYMTRGRQLLDGQELAAVASNAAQEEVHELRKAIAREYFDGVDLKRDRVIVHTGDWLTLAGVAADVGVIDLAAFDITLHPPGRGQTVEHKLGALRHILSETRAEVSRVVPSGRIVELPADASDEVRITTVLDTLTQHRLL